MNSRICIVGKGCSLLSHKIGSLIDSHDIIIRVNHLPNDNNHDVIGLKTHIFSTQSPDKLSNHIDKLKNLDIWISSDDTICYEQFNLIFKMINENEMSYIKKYFGNVANLNNSYMPDAGISSILLALLRYPSHKINVCGFDLYENGNISIDNVKKDSSNFTTPVFQQVLYYKTLIKSGVITQLY